MKWEDLWALPFLLGALYLGSRTVLKIYAKQRGWAAYTRSLMSRLENRRRVNRIFRLIWTLLIGLGLPVLSFIAFFWRDKDWSSLATLLAGGIFGIVQGVLDAIKKVYKMRKARKLSADLARKKQLSKIKQYLLNLNDGHYMESLGPRLHEDEKVTAGMQLLAWGTLEDIDPTSRDRRMDILVAAKVPDWMIIAKFKEAQDEITPEDLDMARTRVIEQPSSRS